LVGVGVGVLVSVGTGVAVLVGVGVGVFVGVGVAVAAGPASTTITSSTVGPHVPPEIPSNVRTVFVPDDGASAVPRTSCVQPILLVV
jgi:hypothetical protein